MMTATVELDSTVVCIFNLIMTYQQCIIIHFWLLGKVRLISPTKNPIRAPRYLGVFWDPPPAAHRRPFILVDKMQKKIIFFQFK